DTISNAVGSLESIPLALKPAAEGYSRFKQRQQDDARLLTQLNSLKERATALGAKDAAKPIEVQKPKMTAEQCSSSFYACYRSCPPLIMSSSIAYKRCTDSCGNTADACRANLK